MNFSTLQGLTIPEGVVTQIADASGMVLWMLNTGSDKVILEVEKITSDTYAGGTTYTGEQFVLLDIYPKTNGTVSVTYGGLTKTITDTSGAEEPNAIQVFFGTFNSVADDVETPASGTLTIEGKYRGVSVSTFAESSKSSSVICDCITEIVDFGSQKIILDGAFEGCTKLTSLTIPSSIESIGTTSFSLLKNGAFARCTGLTHVVISEGVKNMAASTFSACNGLVSVLIPSTLTSMGSNPFSSTDSDNFIVVDENNPRYIVDGNCLINKTGGVISGFNNSVIPAYVTEIVASAFLGCKKITSIEIPEGVGYIGMSAFSGCTGLTNVIMRPTTPPDLTAGTFQDVTCPITVPAGCGEAYKAASGWSDYADLIVEET